MDASKWIRRPDPPTLPYFFALDWLDRAVEKPRFGEPYVPFGRLTAIGMLMFETGALVGHALREQLPTLTLMLGDPWTQMEQILVGYNPNAPMPHDGITSEDWYTYLRSSPAARERAAEQLLERGHSCLADYGIVQGFYKHKEPHSFFELYMYAFLHERAVAVADFDPFPEEDSAPALREFLHDWASDKEEIIGAYAHCESAMEAGLGMGAKYPDMTESLWRNTWEHPDEAEWEQWASLGLPLEKPPKPITFEERQESLLSVLRVFVDTYYPEAALIKILIALPELAEPLFGRQRPKRPAKRRARRKPGR